MSPPKPLTPTNRQVFNTTATLHHASPLPAGTTKAHAVQTMLQDHEFFIQCGPHSVEREKLAGDEVAKLAATALASDAKGEHPLPEAVRSLYEAAAKGPSTEDSGGLPGGSRPRYVVYRVTDLVQTLPAGLWDSHVVSTYEMADTAAGVFVRIRSPMSIVMDTTWTVSEAEGTTANELELVEEIVIYCSRLLVGTVKSLCEGGWQQIHSKMIAQLTKGEGGEKKEETNGATK